MLIFNHLLFVSSWHLLTNVVKQKLEYTFLHGLIKMSGKVSIHSAVFLMNLIDLHLTFDNYYFLKRAGVQITITCARQDVS